MHITYSSLSTAGTLLYFYFTFTLLLLYFYLTFTYFTLLDTFFIAPIKGDETLKKGAVDPELEVESPPFFPSPLQVFYLL